MADQLSFEESPAMLRDQLDQLTRAYSSLHDEVHQLFEFARTVFLVMHFDLCNDEEMNLDGKWVTNSVVRGVSDKHDDELSEILNKLTFLDRTAYECRRKVGYVDDGLSH